LRKNDGGGDDRAEDGTAAHFIETGNAERAEFARGLLECESARGSFGHVPSIRSPAGERWKETRNTKTTPAETGAVVTLEERGVR
jgi:hypothetical protein